MRQLFPSFVGRRAGHQSRASGRAYRVRQRAGRTIATGSHAKLSSCQAVLTGAAAAPPEPSAKRGASTASPPAAPDQLRGIASWSIMARGVRREAQTRAPLGCGRSERGRAPWLTVPRYDRGARGRS